MNGTADLAAAVEAAVRAPSVHNTQPWRWRIRPGAVELHADWSRHLPATDPDRRDLLLSCGAALHHLQVALAAREWSVEVARLPDPEDAAHLATVTVGPGPGDPAAAALFGAIGRRRTDRRRMGPQPVADRALRILAEHARAAGAVLLTVVGEVRRARLLDTLADAAARQRHLPGYAAELQVWTRRHAGGRDGIPAASVAALPTGPGPTPLRRFPRAGLGQPPLDPERGTADDAAALLVLATPDDDVVDRLRAGEALSAVLLAATGMGLATTPLSQAVEVAATRRAIQDSVLRVPEHPQLVLRIGRPADGAVELPATPRRDLRAVLLPR